MAKSSKTGQHGAQSMEQHEHVLHILLGSQSEHLVPSGAGAAASEGSRTAIARTRSSLEHELEHGHGLALAPAHELGVGRRCD
jgi:hypothetical protein